jgi:hypothetical protein
VEPWPYRRVGPFGRNVGLRLAGLKCGHR